MGSRDIAILTRSVGGKINVPHQAGLIRTESTLESDFALLCGFDPQVAKIESQPLTISFQDSAGQARRYTPDFLVQFHPDGGRCPPPRLVETKYQSDLTKHADEYAEKFAAAERYADERDWLFQIRTEQDLRGPRLDNAKFLMLYVLEPKPNPVRWTGIQDTLAHLGTTSVRELLNALDSDPVRQLDLLPAVWQQVLQRAILTDLDLPLTMRSALQVSQATHAAEVDA